MWGQGLIRWRDRGPGFDVQWKSTLIWLAIIAVIAGGATLLQLPQRMGCRPVTSRHMNCQRSLFSAETWSWSSTPKRQ